MQVISRSEAKSLGLKRYFTGEACKNGHVSERYAATSICVSCQRKNNEKYLPAYYEKNREKLKARSRDYAAANQCRAIAKAKEWKTKNRDRANELSRLGRLRNIEKSCATKKRWRDKNKNYINSLTAKRRASKKLATPKWADLIAISEFYKNRPAGLCVDHVVPLQSDIVCGLHCEFNLQYLTRSENSKKGKLLLA